MQLFDNTNERKLRVGQRNWKRHGHGRGGLQLDRCEQRVLDKHNVGLKRQRKWKRGLFGL
jgi:hypothetical protein